eukprot:3311967-Alexandrium_andersonii.AAC.1
MGLQDSDSLALGRRLSVFKSAHQVLCSSEGAAAPRLLVHPPLFVAFIAAGRLPVGAVISSKAH